MNNNRTYIILAFTLIIFSLLGLYYFNRPTSQVEAPVSLAEVSVTPTDTISTPQLSPEPTFTPSDNSLFPEDTTPITSSPTMAPPVPTTTPEYYTLNNPQYNFTLSYSSRRRLYEDPENSGVRFTFYSPSGNIALHVGPDWSWQHPGRQFNSDTYVSGHQAFVYKTTNQTIIDFESGDIKYTIQCVHNSQEIKIQECTQFTTSFSLTSGS